MQGERRRPSPSAAGWEDPGTEDPRREGSGQGGLPAVCWSHGLSEGPRIATPDLGTFGVTSLGLASSSVSPPPLPPTAGPAPRLAGSGDGQSGGTGPTPLR